MRGVASPRPRRASKRLDCMLGNTRPLASTSRKGKVVIIKTRRYKRLVLAFVFAPETDMIFGDGVAPMLDCVNVSTLEQRSWRRCMGGLKTGLSRRHRIQPAEGPVLDPRAKERVSKRVRKWPRWNQKWSLPGGSSFRPFLTPSLWQICWSVYFKLKLIWPTTAAAGILNFLSPGSSFVPPCQRTCFKKGQKVAPLEIKSGPCLEGLVFVPFWPLHCGKFVEAFISSWSWFDQQQLRPESWTGEAHFCAPAFSYVLRSKKRSLLCHIVLLQFP